MRSAGGSWRARADYESLPPAASIPARMPRRNRVVPATASGSAGAAGGATAVPWISWKPTAKPSRKSPCGTLLIGICNSDGSGVRPSNGSPHHLWLCPRNRNGKAWNTGNDNQFLANRIYGCDYPANGVQIINRLLARHSAVSPQQGERSASLPFSTTIDRARVTHAFDLFVCL